MQPALSSHQGRASGIAPPGRSPTTPLFGSLQPSRLAMRIVVTFDTPYGGWDHPDHERQMATEVAAWKHDEPEMEYQIADALRVKGHDVRLVGVRNDLQYLVRCLDEIRPTWCSTPSSPFTATPAWNTWSRGCSRLKGTT